MPNFLGITPLKQVQKKYHITSSMPTATTQVISTSLPHSPAQLPLWRRPNAISSSLSKPSDQNGASKSYLLTFTNLNAIAADKEAVNFLVIVIERMYDLLAYAILDFGSLTRHDLEIRFGNFVLEFHCLAEYLSIMAVKAVARRLGQMIQGGLTGLVAGEIVDVQTAVRTIFAFDLLLRLPGG